MSTWGINPNTNQLEPNKHMTYGNDDYHTPMSFHYHASVTDDVCDFLEEVANAKYPNAHDVKIIGSIYDYTKANVTDYVERPIGHYRIRVDGEDKIFVVVDRNPDLFLRPAADYVAALEADGLSVIQTIPNKDGTFANKIEYAGGQSLYAYEEIHLQKSPEWMIQTGIDERTFELGTLIGKIHTSSKKFAQENPEKLIDMQAFMDEYKMTPMRTLYAQEKDGLSQDTQKFLDKFLNPETPWVPTTGNFIEKQPIGVVTLAHDSATQGYITMMTDNACYDCGLAVARIITNSDLYISGQDVENGLEGFVDGYNKETGYSLSMDEAMQAGLNAFITLGLYGRTMGIHSDYKNTLDDHINNVLNPHKERFAVIQKMINEKGTAKIPLPTTLKNS